MKSESQPFQILINSDSGTAKNYDENQIKEAINRSGLNIRHLHFVSASDFFDLLEDTTESEHPVLIGGGDGTITSAARVFIKSGKPFGILPFGTMNMLARDLDIPLTLDEMFLAYKNFDYRFIDVASLNDEPYLCAAALGIIPEASLMREKTRGEPDLVSIPKIGHFVFNELDQAKQRRLYISIDGKRKKIKASSIIVSNNQYDIEHENSEFHFKKNSLDDAILGIYTVSPLTTWQRIRLLFKLHFGGWKMDSTIKEYRGQNVTIEGQRKKEMVSLDGEPLDLEAPLSFQILPKALKLIAPCSGDDQ